ncbi:MAG TPA: aryl-sulfate sulfotransferase [Bacteroidota bacterium]|nr:aryl-sulfate sulfotransferase [Bacteroidota bacterium]
MTHRYVVPLLSALVVCVSTAGAATGHFRYLYPLPGSTMVSSLTDIIIRPDAVLARGALTMHCAARGEASGPHDGRTLLSDDGATTIFLPSVPFAPGERVTVAVSREGGAAAEEFSFTISPYGASTAVRENLRGPGSPESGLLSVAAAGLPPDFPAITVSAVSNPAPGCLFLSNMTMGSGAVNTPFTMILDNGGQPLYYRRTAGESTDFKPQPNGLLTYNDSGLGCFLALDSTLAVVDTFRCGNGYPTNWHELRILPDGHALILGDDSRTVRMDTIVPGGNPAATVMGIVVQELDRSKNVVFEWRTFDHFAITDATHEDLTAGYIDAVHSNALEMDTDGNILLSSRHLDEITKINRQTGAIVWRWGGKNNQFTFVNDTLGFRHQHAIRRLASGNVTLFDNGDFRIPLLSRAVEYTLDEVHLTATLVWQYRNTPTIYASAMGYTQRLPNGNTLVGWGASNTAVTEVTPSGTLAFQLNFPPGVYSYRAYKFPWHGPALSASAGAALPRAFSLEGNYPNPFNPSTTIVYDLPSASRATLRIVDILGREVARPVDGFQEAGRHTVVFDGAALASGVYVCRLEAGAVSAARKMMLIR